MLNFSRQLFHRQMRASSVVTEVPDWEVAVVVVEGAGVVALEVELSPPPDGATAGLVVAVAGVSVGAGGADMVDSYCSNPVVSRSIPVPR